MESSDDETKKILKKIERLMLESKKLDMEGLRRQQVAQMKFYGWLIEWIQSQRDKLKQKKKIGNWLTLLQRVTDLRTQVMVEYLSMTRYGIEHLLEESMMRSPVRKMIEIYNALKQDLSESLYEEDSKRYNLPHIEGTFTDPLPKLSELNVCLGQLLAHAFGKLYEYIS